MAIRAFSQTATGEVSIMGSDPFFRTPLRAGEVVSSILAATGVAINDIWELRGHARQKVCVSVSEAAATLRSMDYTRARGRDGAYRPIPLPAERAQAMGLCRPYRTRDGRWFLPHFSLGLGVRVLDVLGCSGTTEAIAAAVSTWDAAELEEAIAGVRACGGMVRTRKEWLAHPQGVHLAQRSVVELARTGPAPAEPLRAGSRPLSGIRVLDVTRIIAGPVASRGLAEHGADVLMVTARHLPQGPEHVRDTSHGKRSCFLDLRTPEGAARFAELVREADVIVNSYRPGALEALGFGMQELARLRPGIVQVSVSCYGLGGPFTHRGGWEQVAQAVTGICDAQGIATGAGEPRLVSPLVCDFTTGYLATYGAVLALGRRAREGGSWHVQVSLCRSAMFLQSQGLLSDFAAAPETLTEEQLAPLHVQEEGVYGDIQTLGPVLRLSETAPYWDKNTPKLGSGEPVWLPR
ncbi:CoA transferase [Verticiella sediminum]|uniref:CoA transferase n=1 Tax=Verticiella sediminum TaxID=1247510 RepID=A0A556A9I4_9BURK|nr:CoA transferase [Verticiella sediminum]TSH89546.1 CoA transferase [Verticiella sediminum]